MTFLGLLLLLRCVLFPASASHLGSCAGVLSHASSPLSSPPPPSISASLSSSLLIWVSLLPSARSLALHMYCTFRFLGVVAVHLLLLLTCVMGVMVP
jgi:hypothetical protein